MEFLYHGSTVQGLKTLEPKKRFTPAGAIDYSAIYASRSPAFAICHSFPWSSDEGIDIETKDEGIQPWHTTVPVTVIEEIRYESVIDALERNAGSVKYI
jgi:hypothetical protein